MSTFTENYNLIKPNSEDYYDVSNFNENMDLIDAQMAKTAETMTAMLEQLNVGSGEKVYTPTETVQHSLAEYSTTSDYCTVKLMHFTAKYSGSILLHLNYKTTASSLNDNHDLYCYQAVDKKFLELDAFAVTDELTYAKAGSAHKIKLGYDINDAKIILPVEKGQTYYFELYINSMTSLKIPKAEICFDVISNSDVTEFNAA